MTFERKALRSVLQKMFRDYRERLARIFKEAGAGRESHMLGAALVALSEGFFFTADGNPQGF
jgi:predicted PurR-regulated permease PerM